MIFCFLKQIDASTPSHEEFKYAVSVLHHHEMSHIIRDWFMGSFQDDLCSIIIPEFWQKFQSCDHGIFYRFPDALDLLYERLISYVLPINELQSVQDNLFAQIHTLPPDGQINLQSNKTPLMTEVFSVARGLLFAKWHVDFRAVLVEFFSQAFKSYQSKFKFIKEEEPALSCIFCDNNFDQCCCEKYLDTFYGAIKKLYELKFFETVSGDVPINVAQDAVKKYIQDSCTGNLEKPRLYCLRFWLDNTVIMWLSSFYWKTYGGVCADKLISEYKDRLLNILYDEFTSICMEQLFDIITKFPESFDALEDLKECLKITNIRAKLITSIQSSLATHVLHAGMNTSDILSAYISFIKALRFLDHSGVLVQIVSEPVSKYLRSREDTVRCIVCSLWKDSCGELACELMKGVPLKLEESHHSSDEEIDDWDKWCPNPIDVDPAKSSESQRSCDILGILVNIYGNNELFAKEYQCLLADRILTTFSYDTEQDMKYLELMKLKFGESQFNLCEVMLKDVADSKRLNAHLNSGECKSYKQGDYPVNAMILSAQFWPPLKEEKLRLPEYIWKHLKSYTTAFESLKRDRTLVWKPHLGNVDLEIELKGKILYLSVSPVHATILWHFQNKTRWTINELSSEMQMQASVVRKKITFWQNHAVLSEEENDVFVLMEDQDNNKESIDMIEEEEESVTASCQDMKDEELQTFWSYIEGMLRNMKSLPLERIHSMLRMLVQDTSTHEWSMEVVKLFLEKKVRENQLVCSAGMFKLPNSNS